MVYCCLMRPSTRIMFQALATCEAFQAHHVDIGMVVLSPPCTCPDSESLTIYVCFCTVGLTACSMCTAMSCQLQIYALLPQHGLLLLEEAALGTCRSSNLCTGTHAGHAHFADDIQSDLELARVHVDVQGRDGDQRPAGLPLGWSPGCRVVPSLSCLPSIATSAFGVHNVDLKRIKDRPAGNI